MRHLVEWFQGQKPDSNLNPRLVDVLPHVMREKLSEGGDGVRSEPLAFSGESVFEGALPDAEALEQVAAIERHSLLEGVRRAARDARLKARDVSDDRERLETDQIRFDPNGLDVRFGEHTAKVEETLPKRVARSVVALLTPEQRCEFSTGQHLSQRQSEDRQ